ncbi:sodium/potassium/calcium exchanger 4-like [Huso huso]|uniref:Sodium/potassium/calcium exchanger 4-like n=1 Tax=Huso huso TaxID=61971 RepID=A0ABR0Z2S8_HUSHU
MDMRKNCNSSKMTVLTKITKVRKRREMLLLQICIICSVLFIAWSMSTLLSKMGLDTPAVERQTASERWGNRKLMAMDMENETLLTKNCTEPGTTDGCSIPQGSMAVLQKCYLGHSQSILSLQKLHLSEDVAGATFMAAGSSAPELFASVIGVFITHGDVGVGTIVGSAVFNILCIIGVCGIFAGQVVVLTWWSVFRDSLYYTFSVLALIACIYDEQIDWWEALILILMYAGYILIMKFNTSLQIFFTAKVGKNLANGGTVSNETEDGNACYDIRWDDPSLPLLRKVKMSKTYSKNSVVMVDEIICSSPPKLRFPEAGLRIMITNHFGPKTRLRMASRLIINEHQRLVQAANGVDNGDLEGKHDNIENGNVPEDKQGEDDEPDLSSPFSIPAGCMNKVKWLFSWPVLLLLYFTVPNCAKPRWEKYFMLSFILSTVWIAVFSYFMVWMVTVIGYTLGIPDVIMGITFLAAGTSVPDCMASLIVARQGLGDMAVSNTIGSNVFDILIGLGLPWGLQTMVVNYGSVVKINSRGLVYSVVLLLGSVGLTVMAVHINKWKLDKKLGVYVLVLYAVFLCFSVMIEFNVFTFVNLPMCREDI